MARLEQSGSEQTRKTCQRHGIKRLLFGVSFSELEKLRKQLKTNQLPAEHLWATGNHEARVLATMIADPAVAIPASFGRCVRELDHQLLSWGLAWLASKSTSTPEIFSALAPIQ